MHPKYIKHLNLEKLFYSKLIKRNSFVYDIGANIGNKTKLFNTLGFKVLCIEPDNFNFNKLLKRFKSKSITIINYAVSDSIGDSFFYVEEPGSAFNTLSKKWKVSLETPEINRWHSKRVFDNKHIKVKTVTLDYLIQNYGKPYYVKIDVEGHELNVLKGLSYKIPIISFEANLPEFKKETIDCVKLLFKIDNHITFNYIVNDESFELQENIDQYEMISLLNSTERRYLEIFSFMSV